MSKTKMSSSVGWNLVREKLLSAENVEHDYCIGPPPEFWGRLDEWDPPIPDGAWVTQKQAVRLMNLLSQVASWNPTQPSQKQIVRLYLHLATETCGRWGLTKLLKANGWEHFNGNGWRKDGLAIYDGVDFELEGVAPLPSITWEELSDILGPFIPWVRYGSVNTMLNVPPELYRL